MGLAYKATHRIVFTVKLNSITDDNGLPTKIIKTVIKMWQLMEDAEEDGGKEEGDYDYDDDVDGGRIKRK